LRIAALIFGSLRLAKFELPLLRMFLPLNVRSSSVCWPEQVPLYEELYRDRAYLGAAESKPVRQQVRAFARELGVADRRRVKLGPPPEPEQLSLAL